MLIDDNLKPWLLEVNLSPSLSCNTKLDLNVKGNLLADLFTLIGIVPLDQRQYGQKNFNSNYNVYARMATQNPYNSFTGNKPPIQLAGGKWGSNKSKRLLMPKEDKLVIKEASDENKR